MTSFISKVQRAAQLIMLAAWDFFTIRNVFGWGMILMGMAIIDNPTSGVAGYMLASGIPIRVYALLLTLCGTVILTRSEQLVFAFAMTPYILYIFFSLEYFLTSPAGGPTWTPVVIYATSYLAAMSHALKHTPQSAQVVRKAGNGA